jgi:phage minor structural protein
MIVLYHGATAINFIKSNSIGSKEIDVFSDIDTKSTAYYQRMSMYKALHDTEQSFLNRWGGEVQRRGYTLRINKRIGSDRGVLIHSRKNITGFNAKTNVDTVFTRIKPVGFNGITIKGYVDSPNISKYSRIKTREIKYEDVKVKDESNPDEGYDNLSQAQDELIRRSKLEFTDKHIDELKGEYNINFIQLEDTEEFKEFIVAERVFIGDTVNVYEDKLDIEISVRAIKRKYDILKQTVLETTLSNNNIHSKAPSVSDIIAEIGKVIDDKDGLDEYVQGLINAGIKDSYVLVRQNEIVIGDTKDINTMTKCWRFNKNGLAHSSNGYYGEFNVAITSDGMIVADFIKTGILTADLIKAGTLSNMAGTFEIDLENGQGITFKSNGKKAIEMLSTIMKFYDWDGKGDAIGQLYSARLNSNENMPGIVLANKLKSYLSLAYERDNNFYSYIRCDKDNVDHLTKSPITVFEETDFRGTQIWFGHNMNSIYKSVGDNLVNKVLNDYIVNDRATGYDRFRNYTDRTYFCNGSNNKIYFNAQVGQFSFWDAANNAYLYKVKDQEKIWCNYNLTVDKKLYVNGDLAVVGNKNCPT